MVWQETMTSPEYTWRTGQGPKSEVGDWGVFMPRLGKTIVKALMKSLMKTASQASKRGSPLEETIKDRDELLRMSSEAQRKVYGWIASKKDMPSEAITILERKLLETETEPLVDLWGRYHLGKLQYKLGQFERCVRTSLKLLELHRSKLPIVATITIESSKQRLSSTESLEISVGGSLIVSEYLLKDDIARCYRNLGENSRKKGDWTLAKEYYQKASVTSPQQKVTDLKWLGDCHYHTGDLVSALECYQEAKRKSPRLAGIDTRISNVRTRLAKMVK